MTLAEVLWNGIYSLKVTVIVEIMDDTLMFD